MRTPNTEEQLEEEFHISRWIIVYKFILGVLELIMGLALLIYGSKIFDLYYDLRDDLLENSQIILVNLLEKLLPFILEHKGFIILLLLLLGITKIVGAIGFYYRKRWGFDLLIGLTFLLLPFDLVDLIRHPTLGRLSYFILNILIALYLVNFKPHKYFYSLKSRVSSGK